MVRVGRAGSPPGSAASLDIKLMGWTDQVLHEEGSVGDLGRCKYCGDCNEVASEESETESAGDTENVNTAAKHLK